MSLSPSISLARRIYWSKMFLWKAAWALSFRWQRYVRLIIHPMRCSHRGFPWKHGRVMLCAGITSPVMSWFHILVSITSVIGSDFHPHQSSQLSFDLTRSPLLPQPQHGSPWLSRFYGTYDDSLLSGRNKIFMIAFGRRGERFLTRFCGHSESNSSAGHKSGGKELWWFHF